MIVVLGAGIAGTAAALAAARLGASVRVVDGGVGATALSSGALDGDAPEGDAATLLDALALVNVGPSILATTAGVLRRASGADRAVLRLEPGATVFVPESSHPRWHGALLTRHFNASPLATEAKLSFVSKKVSLLQGDAEHAMGDLELAARHEDEARLATLGERLRAALPDGATAVLLPPWLGAKTSRAKELSALVGVPCGELLGDPAGPSGERFMHARDAAFARAGIGVVQKRATRIEGLTVTLEGGERLEATALVLAIGGVAGGGVRYTPSAAIPSTALPPYPRATFALSVEAPLELAVDGRPILVPGSMFGVMPEAIALPFGEATVLERVGVLDASAARAGVLLAGDVREGGARTWLEAFASGAAAGFSAAKAAPTFAAR